MELKEGYKQTEVGVIPSDWGIYELGKISKLKNGINKETEVSPFFEGFRGG